MQVVDFERVDALLRHLSGALAARWIYGGDHRRSSDARSDFVRTLRRYIRTERDVDRFTLGIRSGRFTFDGLVASETSGLVRFASELERRGFTAISFAKETDEKSLALLFDWILSEGEEPGQIDGIELSRGAEDAVEASDDPFEPFRVPLTVYSSVHSLLDRLMHSAQNGELDFNDIMAVSRWSAEEAFKVGPMLLSPIQILRSDPYTYRHSVNVFLITAAMLQPIAADPEELSRWVRAALLHDIGKSRVPGEILHKRGALTDEEMDLVRLHPEYGVQVLIECGELDPLVLETAYCHHMRDDGSGYPVANPPIEPGPITRVIAVADIFEAIVSERPYKKARPVAEAIEIIRTSPGLLKSQQAIHLLENTIGDPPAGAEVELATGERGLVLGTEPTDVLICWDEHGEPLDDPQKRRIEDPESVVAVGLHAEKPPALCEQEGATW